MYNWSTLRKQERSWNHVIWVRRSSCKLACSGLPECGANVEKNHEKTSSRPFFACIYFVIFLFLLLYLRAWNKLCVNQLCHKTGLLTSSKIFACSLAMFRHLRDWSGHIWKSLEVLHSRIKISHICLDKEKYRVQMCRQWRHALTCVVWLAACIMLSVLVFTLQFGSMDTTMFLES